MTMTDDVPGDAADDLPLWLGHRLQQPLPPESVRAAFAPSLSYGRHFGPPGHDARSAAVLVLLYRRDGQWLVPFTVRPDTMADHAGQVSFPGGMVESGETTRDGALRELEEELGVARDSVEVLGSLSPMFLFVSNFRITPWVAVARAPIAFRPCDREVAEVLEVPVAHMMNSANYGVHHHQRGELRFSAPYLGWHQYHVWGATCIILAELVAILSEGPAASFAYGHDRRP
jgi:8-oxo-dGTP pyrophosphatase MutT (NUDIX family)